MREIKFRAWFAGAMWEHEKLNLNKALKSKETKLMQYTGLKDKNGTEIYEGDITRFTTTDGKEVVRVCKWNEYKPGFIWDEIGFNGQGFLLSQDFHDSVGAEVIGNIYENPELLK